MGADRPDVCAQEGVRLIARIVPAVPTFSVDEGFRYSVPERFADRIVVGSMVRVPLGGRRVAGFVTAIESGPDSGLKPVASVSGAAPVFDSGLGEVLQWAARYYVAPVSVMLARSAPPNLPGRARAEPGGTPRGAGGIGSDHPLVAVVRSGTARSVVWLDAHDPAIWIGPVGADLTARDRSLLVVVPTGVEVQSLASRLSGLGDHLVTVDHEMDDAAVTAAWGRAHHLGGVVIGTPRIAAWHVARPGAFAVVEESRRAMKDRQTPTVHVRDLILRRAAGCGVPALFAGPAPSLEVVAGDADMLRPAGRVWPLVEVIDRRDDPPGSGLLSERVRQAVRIAVNQGGRVFLFAHRRGYSAASRCGRCRALRRCPGCGSRPDPEPTCRRCGQVLGPCADCGGARFEPLGAGVGRLAEEIGRVVDRAQVGVHPTDRLVTVGTERDLTTLAPCHLVVLGDIDGLVFGAHYRAAEEAFRVGTRLAGLVEPGSGRRLMVQTNQPDHPVISALRRAEPGVFHSAELETRRAMGYPPFGALTVIEVRGDVGPEADRDIHAAAGDATVLGPAASESGVRWLVHGSDLSAFKLALRPVIQRLRDSGSAVRVDVDPIDL